MLNTFRALRSRNYALYFGGQSFSMIGTWMQRTAVSWVIYTMTHSPFMLGVSMFAQQFPSFLFSLYGGVVADRYNRYKLLLLTQIASMIQAVLLTVLVMSNHHSVFSILSLSVILGIINAFDVPVRQPMVHELVTDKNDLPNAVALNSMMVNLARLVGPALSGIILQQFGAGICFLSNAVSFLFVLTSLLLMKLPAYTPKLQKKKTSSEMAEGIRYINRTPMLKMALVLLALISLFVLPYETLIPIFAKEVFSGDAATFGYIRSFMGLGAVGCTLMLASLKKGTDLIKVLMVNMIVLGTGLICFSQIDYFPLAMLFATVSGFGAMSSTICLTLIQVHSDAQMRGRVMGFMAMAFFGMLPMGGLLIGSVSEKVGAPSALLCQGVVAIIIALLFSKFLMKDKKVDEQIKEQDTVDVEVV